MPALQACSACQFAATKVHAAPPLPRRESDTKVRDEAIKKCDIFPIMKHQFAVYDDHNDETIKVEAIGEKEKKIISMVLARSNNKTRALLLLPTANTISQSVHL